MIWIIVATIVLTALAIFLAMNFATPEKELERKIEHRYAIGDPQFRREMSVMMGPAILPGNHVTDLQNGILSTGSTVTGVCTPTTTTWRVPMRSRA